MLAEAIYHQSSFFTMLIQPSILGCEAIWDGVDFTPCFREK